MDQNAWIMLLVGVAVTAGLFALGVAVYPKLKSAQPSTPVEAAVEAALLPIKWKTANAPVPLPSTVARG